MKTLFIEPGSPWENGFVESFNGKLRDELLEREAFDTLLEAKVLFPRWRQHSNKIGRTASWVPAPGPRGVAALCDCYGYASATRQGWSDGSQKPNLENGVIHGGRSVEAVIECVAKPYGLIVTP